MYSIAVKCIASQDQCPFALAQVIGGPVDLLDGPHLHGSLDPSSPLLPAAGVACCRPAPSSKLKCTEPIHPNDPGSVWFLWSLLANKNSQRSKNCDRTVRAVYEVFRSRPEQTTDRLCRSGEPCCFPGEGGWHPSADRYNHRRRFSGLLARASCARATAVLPPLRAPLGRFLCESPGLSWFSGSAIT